MSAPPPQSPEGHLIVALRRVIDAQQAVLSGFHAPGGLLQRAVEAACTATGADAAAVEVLEGGELVCQAACGALSGQVGLRLPLAGTLAEGCIRSNEVRGCVDAGGGPGAVLYGPLEVEGRVGGVLRVTYRQSCHPAVGAVEALRLMARLVGVALAHTHREAQREALLAEVRGTDPEQRFRDFVEHSPCLAFLEDGHGHYLFGDAELFVSEGRTVDEVVERAPDPATLAGTERRVYRESFPDLFGTERRFVTARFLVPGAGGQSLQGGVALDVTQLGRLEWLVAEQAEQARVFFDAAPLFMGTCEVVEDDFRYLSVNRAAEVFFQRPREEVAGRTARELEVPPQLVSQLLAAFRPAIEAGGSVNSEYVVPSQGGPRYHRTTAVRMPSLPGGPPRLAFIVEDVTERRRAEEARDHLARLVESSDDAIIGSGLDGRIQSWNQGAERMFGYTAAEVVGQPMAMLVPEERLSELESVGRRLGAGDTSVRFDSLRLGKGGRLLEVAITVSPVRDASGEMVGRAAILSDISAAKQAERALRASLREKEVLLREVHHRVKNNLQVIISLLRLQASTLEDSACRSAIQASEERVRAIASYHEHLYQAEDVAQVGLDGYIRTVASGLSRAYGVDPARVQLEVAADRVVLPLDQAIPCGLLVSELLSNAFKHAFPGGRSGRVWVRLGPAPGWRLALEVGDDGVGLPPGGARRPGGLGMELVETLAGQLGGTLSVESGPGARFHLRFPAPPGLSRSRGEPWPRSW